MTIELTGAPLEPRRRTPARPYARKRIPSVTTIIGVIDKPGLVWGAAGATAAFALDQPDEWKGLDRDTAWDRMRKHHRITWDEAAARGNAVHAISEAWTWGETIDLTVVVNTLAERQMKAWQGKERFVVKELEPLVDALEAFWNDFEPETIATEEVVATDKLHIGQRDWTAVIDGKVVQIDLKSTSKVDAEPYTDSWRLQHAAYRWSTHIVAYDAAGVEQERFDNYPVDACWNVMLLPDGTYKVWEVDAGFDVYETFLDVAKTHQWASKGHKSPAPQLIEKKAENQ